VGQVRADTADALLRRIAVEQAERRIPALAAAVVRDGEIAWFGARGRVAGEPPTPDTQYRIGSITKTLVATVIMRLRDEGRLDLADPLRRHLPGAPAGEATIAQLLSHTSGLTAEPPGPWWERTPGAPAPGVLADDELARPPHRPGRRLHYSNVGYALLGQVITRLRGMSWDRAVHEEVLHPLGMRATTTRPREPYARGYAVHPWADVLLPEPEHDAGAMGPAGQLWSTCADMARWCAFLAGHTGGVLDPATLAEMRRPLAVDEDGLRHGRAFGLGLQLAHGDGRRLAGHGGSMPGFLAGVYADPEDDLGVLYLANTTSGVSNTLLSDLLRIVAEREPRLPREWTPLPADPDLLELAGPWYWGPAPYLLRLLPERGLALEPMSGQGRASRFTPRPDGTWVGLDGYYAGETLRVVRHDGRVWLEVNTFVFTRAPYGDPAEAVPGGVDPDGWRAAF